MNDSAIFLELKRNVKNYHDASLKRDYMDAFDIAQEIVDIAIELEMAASEILHNDGH